MPPNTSSKLQPLDQGVIQNFKVKYRYVMVKKCVSKIDEGTKPSVNVLEAMRMADKAWNSIETKTIANCFKKPGFLKEFEISDCNEGEENYTHTVESIYEEWHLLSKSLQVDPSTTFQYFVEIDHNVEICGDLTDAEIVREVRSSSSEEDDDNETCEPPPRITFKEAVSSIKTMRAFIQSRSNMTTETFRALTHLENIVDCEKNLNTHQTLLDKYFK